MPEEIKSLKISAKMHRRVRVAAAKCGCTVKDFVEDAIGRLLDGPHHIPKP